MRGYKYVISPFVRSIASIVLNGNQEVQSLVFTSSLGRVLTGPDELTCPGEIG